MFKMTTIQLQIPDALAKKLTQFGSDTERVIIKLLKEKVKNYEEKSILANEYKLSAKENQVLNQDFKHVDAEGWEDEY